MTQPQPIGSLASSNASLTIVVFDAHSATAWVPTKPAATKAMFTGHPAEVMRGLAKGDEATPVDVGASTGFAFELEGTSGQLEVYRPTDRRLALVAPPRAWWIAGHGEHAAEIDAMFAEMLDGDTGEATEIGELELTSGKLAAVYLWHKKVGAARELAATVPAGGALEFGDGYGERNGGLIVDAGAGRHTLARRELVAPWDDELTLVAMTIDRTA